ncbi:hypothetical protein NLJ89_g10450 [Agrocybe chaxingu]|uniref:FAM192A/Fyv6 N-terminal domain-containing protein n=1 Tax=Agrocybe chaxingu TaxID=84603 RepID=A0A9W8MS47_9AGAR|nr:hypothetical protein NLJ89_g10450 [Agrocybe chaxingu]
MDPSAIPSLSAGEVGSRFVSQDEIDTAKARREEQWKAAYARLGQEPPPLQQEDHYDGRSLAEVKTCCEQGLFSSEAPPLRSPLTQVQIAKQEEWEEKNKLGTSISFRLRILTHSVAANQFQRQEEEERRRKEQDGEELKNFKEAVAARTSAANNPPPLSTAATVAAKPKAPLVKKDIKKTLKGVVVKKKPAKPAVSTSQPEAKEKASKEEKGDTSPVAKRRKIDKS